jgi:hypothetical protein
MGRFAAALGQNFALMDNDRVTQPGGVFRRR